MKYRLILEFETDKPISTIGKNLLFDDIKGSVDNGVITDFVRLGGLKGK